MKQFLKDIVSEKSGKGSATRVKSYLCLVVALYLAARYFDKVPFWLMVVLMIASFAPQLIQKFGEINMEKFGIRFTNSNKETS